MGLASPVTKNPARRKLRHTGERVRTCVHTHAHARAHVQAHMQAHTHVRTHTHERTHVHTYTRAGTHVHARAHTHTWTHTHAHTHPHTCTRAGTHTDAHTYTHCTPTRAHMHTHTDAHTCANARARAHTWMHTCTHMCTHTHPYTHAPLHTPSHSSKVLPHGPGFPTGDRDNEKMEFPSGRGGVGRRTHRLLNGKAEASETQWLQIGGENPDIIHNVRSKGKSPIKTARKIIRVNCRHLWVGGYLTRLRCSCPQCGTRGRAPGACSVVF